MCSAPAAPRSSSPSSAEPGPSGLSSSGGPAPAGPSERVALRARLLQEREQWAASALHPAAEQALAAHLRDVVLQLEPERLGLYWPLRSEFNAVLALRADGRTASLPGALPWARKNPRSMEYRAWNGEEPTLTDECGIPGCAGPTVVPDVVLVPCVGYTRRGYRLGYGGGYFDRWLAEHPHVTAIGIAWSASEVDFVPEPHDHPLSAIVTERGVVAE
ncbi:5-formyltetrahydrofolate cyclo-ligase [Caldimonas aquatica]|uniref:5-formyltetrahydrofolate cyclo-ligase n=1 Tax=Caldimonas aquatica TaxID=376175 RepID=A0ABY6MTI4_9BURK|nr:5-formyltetrahydrofolate cyclo-ligase [Schlegelella aquatica]UZD55324.1 5-formyltetrahydrofolate cyclo-ligase [Schlegelella aquatica]